MYRIVRKEALRPTVTLYEIEAPVSYTHLTLPTN